MLIHAERALADGRADDAIANLLDVWRETRAPEVAELLELVSIPVTARALPGLPDRAWLHVDSDYYPWSWHPWRELAAPDPRTTVPLVLGANHVFDLASEHSPHWPDKLDDALLAHGDPRAAAMLDRTCAGRFAAQRAALAARLPRPRKLDAGARAIVRRMTDAVAATPTELRDMLARATAIARRQLVALGFRDWLPALAWHVLAATFDDDAACVAITVPPIPESLAAIAACPELAAVRSMSLYGDQYSACDEHGNNPNLVHRGAEVRRAMVELLARAPQIRTMRGVSSQLVRALVAARVRIAWTEASAWHDGSLFDALSTLDPPLERLELLSLPYQVATPAALAPLWELPVGRRLRELSVEARLASWEGWLISGGVPAHVETLELRRAGRTYGATATRDGHGWVLALDLYRHWDNYDAEFEDPPTPTGDLIALLEMLPPDTLTGLVVDELAERSDDATREQLVQAALRQRDLTRLVVPRDDCQMHDELDTCAACREAGRTVP